MSIREIPLFPLKTVLFPGGPLPLRIFEPRYLDMIGRCMRNDIGFGAIAIREGTEIGPAEIYGTGTQVAITDWYQAEDGILGILAIGRRRIRVLETRRESDGLLLGRVESLKDRHGVALPPQHAAVADILRTVIEQVGGPYRNLDTAYDDAGWVSGRLAELLPIGVDFRQRWLEIDDPVERLDAMLPTLSELAENEPD